MEHLNTQPFSVYVAVEASRHPGKEGMMEAAVASVSL
jgi:hypothetical protein